MSLSRDELIERLEDLGFDSLSGIRKDWRSFLSDEHLRANIVTLLDVAMRAQRISPLEGEMSAPGSGLRPARGQAPTTEGGNRARSRGEPPSALSGISPSRGEIDGGQTSPADSERGALIAKLESLGYDAMVGVQKDWRDWRIRFSDRDLEVIATNIEMAQQNAMAQSREAPPSALSGGASHGSRPSFGPPTRGEITSGTIAPDEPEWPDISELVDVIEKAGAALVLVGMPETAPKDVTRRLVAKALRACFDILNTIETVRKVDA